VLAGRDAAAAKPAGRGRATVLLVPDTTAITATAAIITTTAATITPPRNRNRRTRPRAGAHGDGRFGWCAADWPDALKSMRGPFDATGTMSSDAGVSS
jgi:hypothetical protein